MLIVTVNDSLVIVSYSLVPLLSCLGCTWWVYVGLLNVSNNHELSARPTTSALTILQIQMLRLLLRY